VRTGPGCTITKWLGVVSPHNRFITKVGGSATKSRIDTERLDGLVVGLLETFQVFDGGGLAGLVFA
jgi:hypothetical protein